MRLLSAAGICCVMTFVTICQAETSRPIYRLDGLAASITYADSQVYAIGRADNVLYRLVDSWEKVSDVKAVKIAGRHRPNLDDSGRRAHFHLDPSGSSRDAEHRLGYCGQWKQCSHCGSGGAVGSWNATKANWDPWLTVRCCR
jgi:hypothetical protein